MSPERVYQVASALLAACPISVEQALRLALLMVDGLQRTDQGHHEETH
jgi:hypothetical protein